VNTLLYEPLQFYSHRFCITWEYRRPSTARREVFVQLMLTGEVPHLAVCGMLWNCLFPAQFPEFWYTDVHAEMDAVSETICGGGGGLSRRERRTKPLQSETAEVLTDFILFVRT